MKFISLGNSCKVRESIDRNNGNSQSTLIFDWVISNFDAVVKIFEKISEYKENEIFNNLCFYNEGVNVNNQTHYCASHNKILFKSIHDLTTQKTYDEQVDELVDKYRRRSHRLRQIIQTETETLHFIYFISFSQNIPSIEEMFFFITYVEKMRSNKPFLIHLLVPPEFHDFREKLYSCVITNHVKIVFMDKDKNIDPVKEQRRDLSWEKFYQSLT